MKSTKAGMQDDEGELVHKFICNTSMFYTSSRGIYATDVRFHCAAGKCAHGTEICTNRRKRQSEQSINAAGHVE